MPELSIIPADVPAPHRLDAGKRKAERIMIVDDNPANLRLLEEMLTRKGHQVQSFPRGRLALAAAARVPPELILLDIDMPEMNGYEVCERLKAAPRLASIPVIFLSALTQTADKLRAFQAGGVDYISKPFQFEEVHARVETHLRLGDLQRTLKLQNEQLEESVALRTHELAEANQRLSILDRSKSEFLALISHELRTPLNGLLGVGEIILAEMEGAPGAKELRGMFDRSCGRLLAILENALLLTEIDVRGGHFGSAPVSLNVVLQAAVDESADYARACGIRIALPCVDFGPVSGDSRLLVRAFRSLLEAAVQLSSENETIRLFPEESPDAIRITIESHGRTIPPADLGKFFDLFSISEVSVTGVELGLGPALAERIFSLFGAKVSVANCDPQGVRLSVCMHRA